MGGEVVTAGGQTWSSIVGSEGSRWDEGVWGALGEGREERREKEKTE